MTLSYISHSVPTIHGVFTTRLDQNLGFEPQNLPWGDSMPNKAYSFIDGFSRYHQIKIMLEDRNKTTFTMEWGFFQYTILPFGLMNVPIIFSYLVIEAFKEFIHKFLEVHFDDSTVFGL